MKCLKKDHFDVMNYSLLLFIFKIVYKKYKFWVLKKKFLKIFDIIVYYLILFICVLINVAFLTLLERKILGLSQNRLGPNKVGFMGLLQPFSDGIKLFSKDEVYI
jgi:NADH:ubiquinone oxidoreductase subunit H